MGFSSFRLHAKKSEREVQWLNARLHDLGSSISDAIPIFQRGVSYCLQLFQWLIAPIYLKRASIFILDKNLAKFYMFVTGFAP